MPIIRTTLLKGFTTNEQKSALAGALTDALIDTLGEPTRPYIFSLVDEVEPGTWQVQGQVMTAEMIAAGRAMCEADLAKKLTAERVHAAYDALASGDRAQIDQYWDSEITWLVPGESQVSGNKVGIDDFLKFMGLVGDLSGNSFEMVRSNVFILGDTSIDLSHNTGTRAGDPSRKLSIDVAHQLTWRDGKVVEGRGAIFGTGTTEFNQFWA
jgi:phenylpyruvate tautomerase PptA (4-oxalocrotonate tautomerase family)/ketosteroid isomerase-like protein